MLIIIMGCSFEKPFWARRLGSIPSTLKDFLETGGVEYADVDENRYFRFFFRKTGCDASSAHKTRERAT
jgi:hypothetical protein